VARGLALALTAGRRLIPVLRQVVVADRPPGGAVEIVELAVLERPKERGEAEDPESERERDEVDENVDRRALIVPKGGDANFDAHLGIAKRRHAGTSPYRLMVRHSPPELTGHFGSRRQDGAVRFRRVIRVDMGDVPPVKTDSVQHERHIVESFD
jgi:hypothetical protein